MKTVKFSVSELSDAAIALRGAIAELRSSFQMPLTGTPKEICDRYIALEDKFSRLRGG